jgi:hypothetical protein
MAHNSALAAAAVVGAAAAAVGEVGSLIKKVARNADPKLMAEAKAGRFLRTSTQPMLNRPTESARLYEHSPRRLRMLASRSECLFSMTPCKGSLSAQEQAGSQTIVYRCSPRHPPSFRLLFLV